MLRTPAQVKRDMSQPNSVAVMQSQSQHILKSAFDNVRFGSHNKRGIFGACPGEILHLVLIGWFKYAMESFVGQAGALSSACTKYDALCAKSRVDNIYTCILTVQLCEMCVFNIHT